MPRRKITQDQAHELLWKLNQLRNDVRTIEDAIRTEAYNDPQTIADLLTMILEGNDPYAGTNASWDYDYPLSIDNLTPSEADIIKAAWEARA